MYLWQVFSQSFPSPTFFTSQWELKYHLSCNDDHENQWIKKYSIYYKYFSFTGYTTQIFKAAVYFLKNLVVTFIYYLFSLLLALFGGVCAHMLQCMGDQRTTYGWELIISFYHKDSEIELRPHACQQVSVLSAPTESITSPFWSISLGLFL